MHKKRRKLPYNYLEKYLKVKLTIEDYNFIKGCLLHQKNYCQLNHLQWKAIDNIEKRYLHSELEEKNDNKS